MRNNLFLLMVCIILLFVLKQAKAVEVLEQVEVNNSFHYLKAGKVFIPKTINNVNSYRELLLVAGKTYIYEPCYNNLCLVGEAREVPVNTGAVVYSTTKLKLFVSREL